MEAYLTMPRVVAVIVTFQRLAELDRLLKALSSSTVPLHGCIIADHSPSGEVISLGKNTHFETVVLEDASNPGPGAGWSHAAQRAIHHFGPRVSALWYLDDDVVPSPDCLEILLQDLGKANAIVPLLSDANGALWAFPEPCEQPLRRPIRMAKTPSDALRLIGTAPHSACWATGACLLVTREAYDRVGGHRADFWLLGEDLEYSMRLANQGGLVFTCRTSVPHLPLPSGDSNAARRNDYVKFCSLLQNLCYLSFHSPHSRHMVRYLPGNFRRFFKTHGLTIRSLMDAAVCFRAGAMQGEPAGQKAGTALRERIRRRA